MSSIKYYIANSTGELDKLEPLIVNSLDKVIPIVKKELKAHQIDIIFISAAGLAIPEYGIGGNSPGPNHVYVSFDPKSDKITQERLESTLLHEIHHCMRWRDPGYGETLGEAMITEGLACLYEEQHSNSPPIYATVELLEGQIAAAESQLHSKQYNHSEWFFGTGDTKRWFGYTFGYNACKRYSQETVRGAADLVHMSASEILNYSKKKF